MNKILIPPDAVRVWRGFRSPDLPQDAFFQRLGTVFVPSTVLMQIQLGLDAYIPTIPCGLDGKPETVPDETAILFWETLAAHEQAFRTLAARTYTLTHGSVYTAQSRADFPKFFAGQLVANQPYYLFKDPVDWMHGEVTHVVGGPSNDMSSVEWYTSITQSVLGAQRRGKAQGAIICATDTYLVYWQLGGTEDPVLGELQGLTDWQITRLPVPTQIDHGLWDDWEGMAITPGDSLNMQWTRRNEQ
jgi:hypothetical protein